MFWLILWDFIRSYQTDRVTQGYTSIWRNRGRKYLLEVTIVEDWTEERSSHGILYMMKLVVFGGTGPTGQEVVKQALKLGHIVTVVARTPENMQIR